MKKFLILSLLFILAISSVVVLQPGDNVVVSCNSQLLVTKSPNSLNIFCATPTRTNTPTLTATRTQSPTLTRTATNTPSGPINPFIGAPLCTNDDLTMWHSLWNYQLGCHYSYEQGDNPNLANSIFGLPASAWGGQTISWPWVSSAIENQPTPLGKHNGYKWQENIPSHNPWPACGTYLNNDIDTTGNNTNCITASRIEVHILGSLEDDLARSHSGYVEYQICQRPTWTQCGIFKMGSGLIDFGPLQAPHYNARAIRPGGTVDFGEGIVLTYTADSPDLPNISGEPYVFEDSIADLAQFRLYPPTYDVNGYNTWPRTMGQWATNDLDCEPKPSNEPCHQLYFGFLYQVANSWTVVDVNNPNSVNFVCRDGSCGYTGSSHGIEEVRANIPASWDTNGDGFVDITGFTDRWGNPDTACLSVSFSCIPYSLVHVPVGVAANRMDQGCECDKELNYDITFGNNSSNWIKFPN